MPIDFEMILSASPPLFAAQTFLDFRYGSFHNSNNQRNKLNTAFSEYTNGDIRSCLMAKSDEDQDQKEGGKKRVWFADDKGLALTHVKIMSEPSNCPPRWTDEFLAQVTKGVKPNPTSGVNWVAQFSQPASDYLEFRDRLQRQCVSLENVIIREGDDNVTGTIKVKNLAFDKEVFVRITFDRWSSSKDITATFVPTGVEGGVSQYDTFSFTMSIPPSAAKFETVEFCVCFRTSGVEYWDNNNGNNYKIAAVNRKSQTPSLFIGTQFNDVNLVNLDSWSEFASWRNLLTEGPYW
ncbi:protein phosphatase 1 regulatory subunit 3C-B-like [Uloborus diversus]|uniref:protein phosphatase 1 regulatory subunit 3C-B-like n=1 Tax=Uloborus diversus TaxID=327109 RepID=UPI00240974FA|nr:protein phosphatase 1 regulatory subunit 3C-B-like [Uloborus diversus]